MRKLSNIIESVWSDIQKRSMGKQMRKEDDVNFMDFETFGEYLRNFNKKEVTKVYLDPAGKFITIDEINIISESKERSYERHYQLLLTIEYSESKDVEEIRLPYSFKTLERNVYSKMTKEFSISIKRTADLNISHLNINPKDGSKKTNRFFLDVLNFLLENLKNRYLNESVWSDIQKRSMGKQVRKEDDVDLMEFDVFADYLKNHYTIQSGGKIFIFHHPHWERIDIPLIDDEKPNNLLIYYTPNKRNIPDSIILYIYQTRTIKYIIEKIKEQFNLSVHASSGNQIEYDVSKKDGSKGTNSFIVEFIDFVQDNLRPPHEKILVKK